MSNPGIRSPEGQSATFVELFFDLVFVFSVTQVVGLLHHHITLTGVAQALLVFWLVWWAWTQFTWALNAADTTHHQVELGTLVATAVAFFMAVSLPTAFQGEALAFAIPYVLVRLIGLGIYAWVASSDASQRAAVRIFSLVSFSGLAAVLVGGVLDGNWPYVFWSAAIVLDVIAAAIGGRLQGWGLHAEHFAERHGLFVIIALGETLIVAAGGVTGAAWGHELMLVAVLGVAVTCSLWWLYFTRAKPQLDRALESVQDSLRSRLARDVGSLAHFPMLCGIIAYALAIESALAHPGDPLSAAGRGALCVGLVLFVGGMAAAVRRATGLWLWQRLVLLLTTVAALVFWAGLPSYGSLTLALAGMVLIAVMEQRRLA